MLLPGVPNPVRLGIRATIGGPVPLVEDLAASLPVKTVQAEDSLRIVVEPGQSIDFAEITQLVRTSGLAIQKTPEHVEIVTELPKAASGSLPRGCFFEFISDSQQAARVADRLRDL